MVYVEVENFFDKLEKMYPKKEEIVTIKFDGNDICFRDFIEYLSTIDYKFEICKIYLDKIINKYDLDLEEVKKNPPKLLNLTLSVEFISWVDCFLFQIKCCLDILAQVINLVYKMEMSKKDVNIFKIIENFPDKQNPLYNCLKTHKKGWIDQFNKYRKFITHHKLLKSGSNISGKQGGGITLIPHTLPDDPFIAPKTYRLKIDLKKFFSDCHENTLKIILKLYEEMEKRL